MKKYTVFVIFHDTLNLEYYNESILENFVFVNVRKDNKNVYPNLNVINLHEFKEFKALGSYYAESEVIYNVYKNMYLVDNVDYIGFLHHDIDCNPLTNDQVLNMVKYNELISFETHSFTKDYNRGILMDANKPNMLYGKGVNCYDTIFHDFNSFYNTNFSICDFNKKDNHIILCSCFILKKEIFLKLMEFSSQIIESKKLDIFDTKHKYRIQGGLMERYYAIWFLLKDVSFVSQRLIHNYYETNRQNTFITQVKRKLISIFK